MTDLAYRYEPLRISLGVDEFDRSVGYRVELTLRGFPIVRRTEKGFWIDMGAGSLRFVRNTGRKRYAVLTPEEARANFAARKKGQLYFLRAQIEDVNKQLAALKDLPAEYVVVSDSTL